MCTVSFCPTKEGWLLTSSRDVKLSRPKAIFPTRKQFNQVGLLYPEDGLAEGTWIGVGTNKISACLLNGAFQKHESASSYRKSRGLIVLDTLSSAQPLTYLNARLLEGIEPFTLILISDNVLVENRWDGQRLHKKLLSQAKRHLWSSATLYNEEIVQKRKSIFSDWKLDTRLTEKEIMHYHQSAFEELGAENRALMSRPETNYATVSITCVKATEDESTVYYHDLVNNISDKAKISF